MADDTAPAPPESPPRYVIRKRLRGPHYRQFIWDLLERKHARNYLEIGVRDGQTLAGVTCPAIGVDPAFVIDRNPVGPKRILHLYQMSSDEFFRDHDPARVFGAPVDVAFLDGMHLFEFLLRDFINTERHCDRNSMILLDDCLPINIEMTERIHRREARLDKQIRGWWTGDVWKVVSILREFRPDLRITPVAAEITGSIVVSNLDPMSGLLYDRYFEIVDRYRDVEFTDETFNEYWRVNAPRPAGDLLDNFNLSLYVRS